MTAHEQAADIVKLELEIAHLRERLDAIAERVRLDATAERFAQGAHEIRSGDYVRFTDGHAARVMISDEGKWQYLDRNGRYVEPFRAPPESGIERLYTIAEVAEILARAARGPA